ncbi:hypothetical protein BG845_06039 [Pseudonocardia autotrophica]|uniref:Uncharacterized protein n=1 Tax=Pseudonocardia autotrophica TaxID=2074 RepID=A0A1Y2MKA9_PSEAH|nr:hypothetical protein BG845_06039 [Pseudonocardia autotrophica]
MGPHRARPRGPQPVAFLHRTRPGGTQLHQPPLDQLQVPGEAAVPVRGVAQRAGAVGEHSGARARALGDGIHPHPRHVDPPVGQCPDDPVAVCLGAQRLRSPQRGLGRVQQPLHRLPEQHLELPGVEPGVVIGGGDRRPRPFQLGPRVLDDLPQPVGDRDRRREDPRPRHRHGDRGDHRRPGQGAGRQVLPPRQPLLHRRRRDGGCRRCRVGRGSLHPHERCERAAQHDRAAQHGGVPRRPAGPTTVLGECRRAQDVDGLLHRGRVPVDAVSPGPRRHPHPGPVEVVATGAAHQGTQLRAEPARLRRIGPGRPQRQVRHPRRRGTRRHREHTPQPVHERRRRSGRSGPATPVRRRLPVQHHALIPARPQLRAAVPCLRRCLAHLGQRRRDRLRHRPRPVRLAPGLLGELDLPARIGLAAPAHVPAAVGLRPGEPAVQRRHQRLQPLVPRPELAGPDRPAVPVGRQPVTQLLQRRDLRVEPIRLGPPGHQLLLLRTREPGRRRRHHGPGVPIPGGGLPGLLQPIRHRHRHRRRRLPGPVPGVGVRGLQHVTLQGGELLLLRGACTHPLRGSPQPLGLDPCGHRPRRGGRDQLGHGRRLFCPPLRFRGRTSQLERPRAVILHPLPHGIGPGTPSRTVGLPRRRRLCGQRLQPTAQLGLGPGPVLDQLHRHRGLITLERLRQCHTAETGQHLAGTARMAVAVQLQSSLHHVGRHTARLRAGQHRQRRRRRQVAAPGRLGQLGPVARLLGREYRPRREGAAVQGRRRRAQQRRLPIGRPARAQPVLCGEPPHPPDRARLRRRVQPRRTHVQVRQIGQARRTGPHPRRDRVTDVPGGQPPQQLLTDHRLPGLGTLLRVGPVEIADVIIVATTRGLRERSRERQRLGDRAVHTAARPRPPPGRALFDPPLLHRTQRNGRWLGGRTHRVVVTGRGGLPGPGRNHRRLPGGALAGPAGACSPGQHGRGVAVRGRGAARSGATHRRPLTGTGRPGARCCPLPAPSGLGLGTGRRRSTRGLGGRDAARPRHLHGADHPGRSHRTRRGGLRPADGQRQCQAPCLEPAIRPAHRLPGPPEPRAEPLRRGEPVRRLRPRRTVRPARDAGMRRATRAPPRLTGSRRRARRVPALDQGRCPRPGGVHRPGPTGRRPETRPGGLHRRNGPGQTTAGIDRVRPGTAEALAPAPDLDRDGQVTTAERPLGPHGRGARSGRRRSLGQRAPGGPSWRGATGRQRRPRPRHREGHAEHGPRQHGVTPRPGLPTGRVPVVGGDRPGLSGLVGRGHPEDGHAAPEADGGRRGRNHSCSPVADGHRSWPELRRDRSPSDQAGAGELEPRRPCDRRTEAEALLVQATFDEGVAGVADAVGERPVEDHRADRRGAAGADRHGGCARHRRPHEDVAPGLLPGAVVAALRGRELRPRRIGPVRRGEDPAAVVVDVVVVEEVLTAVVDAAVAVDVAPVGTLSGRIDRVTFVDLAVLALHHDPDPVRLGADLLAGRRGDLVELVPGQLLLLPVGGQERLEALRRDLGAAIRDRATERGVPIDECPLHAVVHGVDQRPLFHRTSGQVHVGTTAGGQREISQVAEPGPGAVVAGDRVVGVSDRAVQRFEVLLRDLLLDGVAGGEHVRMQIGDLDLQVVPLLQARLQVPDPVDRSPIVGTQRVPVGQPLAAEPARDLLGLVDPGPHFPDRVHLLIEGLLPAIEGGDLRRGGASCLVARRDVAVQVGFGLRQRLLPWDQRHPRDPGPGRPVALGGGRRPDRVASRVQPESGQALGGGGQTRLPADGALVVAHRAARIHPADPVDEPTLTVHRGVVLRGLVDRLQVRSDLAAGHAVRACLGERLDGLLQPGHLLVHRVGASLQRAEGATDLQDRAALLLVGEGRKLLLVLPVPLRVLLLQLVQRRQVQRRQWIPRLDVVAPEVLGERPVDAGVLCGTRVVGIEARHPARVRVGDPAQLLQIGRGHALLLARPAAESGVGLDRHAVVVLPADRVQQVALALQEPAVGKSAVATLPAADGAAPGPVVHADLAAAPDRAASRVAVGVHPAGLGLRVRPGVHVVADAELGRVVRGLALADQQRFADRAVRTCPGLRRPGRPGVVAVAHALGGATVSVPVRGDDAQPVLRPDQPGLGDVVVALQGGRFGRVHVQRRDAGTAGLLEAEALVQGDAARVALGDAVRTRRTVRSPGPDAGDLVAAPDRGPPVGRDDVTLGRGEDARTLEVDLSRTSVPAAVDDLGPVTLRVQLVGAGLARDVPVRTTGAGARSLAPGPGALPGRAGHPERARRGGGVTRPVENGRLPGAPVDGPPRALDPAAGVPLPVGVESGPAAAGGLVDPAAALAAVGATAGDRNGDVVRVVAVGVVPGDRVVLGVRVAVRVAGGELRTRLARGRAGRAPALVTGFLDAEQDVAVLVLVGDGAFLVLAEVLEVDDVPVAVDDLPGRELLPRCVPALLLALLDARPDQLRGRHDECAGAAGERGEPVHVAVGLRTAAAPRARDRPGDDATARAGADAAAGPGRRPVPAGGVVAGGGLGRAVTGRGLGLAVAAAGGGVRAAQLSTCVDRTVGVLDHVGVGGDPPSGAATPGQAAGVRCPRVSPRGARSPSRVARDVRCRDAPVAAAGGPRRAGAGDGGVGVVAGACGARRDHRPSGTGGPGSVPAHPGLGARRRRAAARGVAVAAARARAARALRTCRRRIRRCLRERRGGTPAATGAGRGTTAG